MPDMKKNENSSSLRGVVARRRCVLIMDDEEMILSAARLLLKKMGLSVMTAENGEDGLTQFQAHHGEIDCVILDLGMPGMSGHDVLTELIKIQPCVTVILSSGYTDTLQDINDFPQNIAGLLQKPYDGPRLLQAVKEALARSCE